MKVCWKVVGENIKTVGTEVVGTSKVWKGVVQFGEITCKFRYRFLLNHFLNLGDTFDSYRQLIFSILFRFVIRMFLLILNRLLDG